MALLPGRPVHPGAVTAATTPDAPLAAPARFVWWRWPAGLVVLLYVLAHVVELALVRFDGRAYLRVRDVWATPVGRCASAIVVVCVLVHGAFGLLSAWGTMVGEPGRIDDPRSRAAVWFCVVAVAVPAVTLTVWPWLRTL